MNTRVKLALILLTSAATLLGGCLRRPEPTATQATTPAVESTVVATRVALATATSTEVAVPTATATRVVPFTATPHPTATAVPAEPLAPAKSGYQEGFTAQGNAFKGDPAAPVLVEEFSSYQCPFCKRYFQETFSRIVTSYVEAGLVRYVFRDFPLASQPQSSLAARAANCAGQAGGGSAYWAMHDLLFERQTEWSGRANARGIFEGYAAELGLDTAAFGECLDSGATQDHVQADAQEGASRGVRGTPTFYINGRPLVGAQPYDVIARAIDAALAQEVSGDVTLRLAPASALPPEVRQLPLGVQEAYRFALANPDVLEVIPCYCGCNQVGHKNNRMCYIQSETADGRVVFDSHAAT
jgi:protein-disulfide isomerase